MVLLVLLLIVLPEVLLVPMVQLHLELIGIRELPQVLLLLVLLLLLEVLMVQSLLVLP